MTRIFCVGDLNLDFFIYTNDRPLMGREKNIPMPEFSLGGNAANCCMALAGLGLDAKLVSMIGSDLFTPLLNKELKKAGVKDMLFKSRTRNGISIIFISDNGERTILSNNGALAELDAEKISRRLIPLLKEGDIVYFGGYYHLPKVRKEFPKLLSEIKKKKADVLFDATYDEYGKWEIKSFLRQIDTLFLNKLELEKITKKKSREEGIRWLFRNGASKVVLKRGPAGASFFSRKSMIESRALPGKAVNATGAGDFFNAGYIYGLAKGYGRKASMMCGNFVAGKKVLKKEYFLPKARDVEDYLDRQNLVEVRKVKGYDELSQDISSEVIGQLKKKPDSVIALAAGNTPLGTYKKLAEAYRKGRVSFAKAFFVEIDEYLGLQDSSHCLGSYLKKNLLDKTDFKERNVMLFRTSRNPAVENRKFESFIKRKGIDLMVLGIGKNSHIGFNEPGTAFSSRTHVARLSNSTIVANRVKVKGKLPSQAITLGLSTIMRAKRIILAASGSGKAKALSESLKPSPRKSVPASILQRHKNTVFVADAKAL